jgi:hypothetical protein
VSPQRRDGRKGVARPNGGALVTTRPTRRSSQIRPRIIWSLSIPPVVGRCVPTAPRRQEGRCPAERRRVGTTSPTRRSSQIRPRIIWSLSIPQGRALCPHSAATAGRTLSGRTAARWDNAPYPPILANSTPHHLVSLHSPGRALCPHSAAMAGRTLSGRTAARWDNAPYPPILSMNPRRFGMSPFRVRGETKTPQPRLRECGVLKRFPPCWGRKSFRQRDPAPARPSRRR